MTRERKPIRVALVAWLTVPDVSGAAVHGRSHGSRLVAASFLMLFVELVLIRWTAAYVVYLAYFTNFVLLASFLGIGLGFLRAKADPDLFRWSAPALASLLAFVLVFPVQLRDAGGRSFIASAFGYQLVEDLRDAGDHSRRSSGSLGTHWLSGVSRQMSRIFLLFVLLAERA